MIRVDWNAQPTKYSRYTTSDGQMTMTATQQVGRTAGVPETLANLPENERFTAMSHVIKAQEEINLFTPNRDAGILVSLTVLTFHKHHVFIVFGLQPNTKSKRAIRTTPRSEKLFLRGHYRNVACARREVATILKEQFDTTIETVRQAYAGKEIAPFLEGL